jgi:hypothetical protein
MISIFTVNSSGLVDERVYIEHVKTRSHVKSLVLANIEYTQSYVLKLGDLYVKTC